MIRNKRFELGAWFWVAVVLPMVVGLAVSVQGSDTSAVWVFEPTRQDPLTVRFGTRGAGLAMDINSPDDRHKLEYGPVAPGSLYLEAHHRGMTVSYGVRNGLDEDAQVETDVENDYRDFQFRMLKFRHGFEFFYQNYESYHLQNARTFGGDEPFVRGDISTRNVGLNYIYRFDPDGFGLDDVLNHYEPPERSRGGWFGLVSANNHRISADTPLVPSFASAEFSGMEEITGANFYSLSAGGGYGYTLTDGMYYVSGVLFVGVGGQHQKVLRQNDKSRKTIQNFARGSVRLTLGVSGEKHHGGLRLLVDNTPLGLSEGTIDMLTNEMLC